MKLNDWVEELADLDGDEKLQVLVELAEELPPLSAGRTVTPLPESCRIQECQTPVYLWVDVADGRVHLEADVPRKSPTVRGLVALVVDALEGATVAEAGAFPEDFVATLGLQEALGITRQNGARGLIRRIRQELRRVAAADSSQV